MKKTTIILTLICLASILLKAQPAERRMTSKEYIDKYKNDAIREMIHSRVPASIILAQGILESGNGNSPLAMYANNHFGVKCHDDWKGETMHIDDDEKDECFRKYETVYDSYRDHSEFLLNRTRYGFLFNLKINDYKGWAKGLKKAGYATNPKYASLLIALIEENNLSRFDRYAKVPPKNPTKRKKATILASKKKNHTIKLYNNIKYVIAKKGDSFYGIANMFSMNVWQIYKYNDLNKSDNLKTGDIIYLQPKRNKSAEEFHIVKVGDNMRSISQLYGVKLKKLYRKNDMIIGTQPNVGDKIFLKRKKK